MRGVQAMHEAWMPKFLQFVGFNLALACGASLSLFLISPAASGSGIPGQSCLDTRQRSSRQSCLGTPAAQLLLQGMRLVTTNCPPMR